MHDVDPHFGAHFCAAHFARWKAPEIPRLTSGQSVNHVSGLKKQWWGDRGGENILGGAYSVGEGIYFLGCYRESVVVTEGDEDILGGKTDRKRETERSVVLGFFWREEIIEGFLSDKEKNQKKRERVHNLRENESGKEKP